MILTHYFTRVAVSTPPSGGATAKLVTVQKLIKNVKYLLSFNLVQLDSWATTPEGKRQIKFWIGELLKSGDQLSRLDENNLNAVQNNAAEILSWIYKVLPGLYKAFHDYLPPERIPNTLEVTVKLYKEIVGAKP